MKKGVLLATAVLLASALVLWFGIQNEGLTPVLPFKYSGVRATAATRTRPVVSAEIRNDREGKERPSLSPAIQILSSTMKGGISVEELAVIEELYSELVSRREATELSIASREAVDEGAVLITIPEYHEKGEKMWNEFIEEVSHRTGHPKNSRLIAELSQVARTENADFGVREQQILIERRGDTFHVVHGSSALLRLGGRPQIVSRTSISNLAPQHLVSYEYLRSQFPDE
jgi:hypothetical protein